jgi:hypothetical protein
MNLTQEQLKKNLIYNPETGLFVRLKQHGPTKKGPHGGCIEPHGYCTLRIDCKKYYAHRLAWLYVYGKFPNGQIDHENGNRSDNRIKNLRLANQKNNSRNSALRSDNTSGYKGVYWADGKWLAVIHKNKKKYYLGKFSDPLSAAHCYDKAALKLFRAFAKTNFVQASHVLE